MLFKATIITMLSACIVGVLEIPIALITQSSMFYYIFPITWTSIFCMVLIMLIVMVVTD